VTSGSEQVPVDWLRAVTDPGDLVLAGSSDLVSTFIQWFTGAPVNHAATVVQRETSMGR